MPTGYSATPLSKKLGIKQGYKILLYNKPDHYFELIDDHPDDITILNKISERSADFIHIFLTQLTELEYIPGKYKPALKKSGMIWVSWPKGSSDIPTNLNRELVRDQLLELGLVDTKVAAIDKDWSGLKFVYRVKDR